MSGPGNETTAREVVMGRQLRGRRAVGTGALVLVGAFVLILGVLAGGILGHVVAPSAAADSTAEHLYLTVAFDPYTGLDEYFPANFTVPANVPVTITITNYDNGTNAVPAEYSQVRGTVGGMETVTSATASNVSLGSVPAAGVAHTFTVASAPYDINVPIPAAQGETPTIVTFTVVFTATGQFAWHCKAPCDMVAMMTPGFMTGTVTVAGP